MAPERYFVGPRLLTDIRDTISRVQGDADKHGGGHLPGRPAEFAQPSDGLVLGRTVNAWVKGTRATIQSYTGTPGAEAASGEYLEDCVNKFADIEGARWVMLASVNGGWYVVAAECPDE